MSLHYPFYTILLHATLLLFCLYLLAACTAQPTPTPEQSFVGSCSLPEMPFDADEEAIQALLAAEGRLVVAQEIDPLMDLWNDGAQIVDAKHTIDDTGDDQRWLDKDAIRHRYVRTVFPGAATTILPKDLIIAIDGQQAVITSTTQIGDELSPAGDRWVLTKQNGCWVINSLTYNLESRAD